MFKDNDCQVTNMWNVFKETITKSAVKHIPQRLRFFSSFVIPFVVILNGFIV
jgi:hypothetical protein